MWNDIFNFSQDYVGIPRGTVRATVLIETILAAFEMDEIMYELREHSSGLNCGRWDSIFHGFIKKFNKRPDFASPSEPRRSHHDAALLPGLVRGAVDPAVPPPQRPRHGRNGGAQIPIKNDPVANENAMAKVREDKVRAK